MVLVPDSNPQIPMHIFIGTKNPCKVQAVKETIQQWYGGDGPSSDSSMFYPIPVPSGVSEQPMSRQEMVTGAQNRAKRAYQEGIKKISFDSNSNSESESDSKNHNLNDSMLSFGIESGLCRFEGYNLNNETDPKFKSDSDESELDANGWFDICIVSCYDGKQHRIGTSCGFEIPPKIMKHIILNLKDSLNDGVVTDLSQACSLAGVATEDIGEREGLIGVLTGNKITRLDYTKQAISCSLIARNNGKLFND